MRFRGFFYSLAVVITLSGAVRAADQAATAEPQPGVVKRDAFDQPNRSFFDRQKPSGLKPGTSEPFTRPEGSGRFQLRSPRSLETPLCYTMRTYMVKPSERLADDESGFRGYSSCQLASGYRFRSADAQEETGASLKSR
jgi:hypothetical protein